MAVDSKPDVAIVDLSLKTGHGLELIKRLKAHNPDLKILVWSMHPESLYAERVLHAGALGYINKENATDQIIEAIRRVRDNKVYLSAVMSERLLSPAAGAPSERFSLSRLSDRELETFELLGQGLNSVQVAAKMRLSPKPVETYRSRIKEKLDLHKGTELVQRTVQWVLEKR